MVKWDAVHEEGKRAVEGARHRVDIDQSPGALGDGGQEALLGRSVVLHAGVEGTTAERRRGRWSEV